MDTIESLDREVVIERAEAVRFWLDSLHLSEATFHPLQRELEAIIENNPGAYINGQRPLAGLTVDTFIAEAQRPSGGAIRQVKQMNDPALDELRQAIMQAALADYEGDLPAPTSTPVAPMPPRRPRGRPKTTVAPAAMVAPLQVAPAAPPEPVAAPSSPAPAAGEPAAEESAPPRRPRGRPRGSTSAPPTPEPAAAQAAPEPPAASAPEAAPAEQAGVEAEPARRRPGRPKGSKNAPPPPLTPVLATATPADIEPAPAEPVATTAALSIAAPADVAAEPIGPEPTVEEPAPPRRPRGRPKGSTNAARRAAAQATAAAPDAPEAESPRRRRGRPPRAAAPAGVANRPADTKQPGPPAPAAPRQAVAPADAHDHADPLFRKLTRIWSALHPQARHAVAHYASTLMAESAYEE